MSTLLSNYFAKLGRSGSVGATGLDETSGFLDVLDGGKGNRMGISHVERSLASGQVRDDGGTLIGRDGRTRLASGGTLGTLGVHGAQSLDEVIDILVTEVRMDGLENIDAFIVRFLAESGELGFEGGDFRELRGDGGGESTDGGRGHMFV